MRWLSVEDTFELKGPPAEIGIEEASTRGDTGDEVACLQLPLPDPLWNMAE